ncbi:MAG: hypothetical protein F6K14_13750 [Symploca sp. SIO2C1]|nr:hypothetical protein [Symploca sp. SIO2C1]
MTKVWDNFRSKSIAVGAGLGSPLTHWATIFIQNPPYDNYGITKMQEQLNAEVMMTYISIKL